MDSIRPLDPPPACILWDIDGTLTDTTDLIIESLDTVYRAFYRRTLPPAEIRAIIGTPLRDQIRVFGVPSELGVDEAEITDAFIRHYELNRHRERILTDVIDVLRGGNRQGIPTGLVTSKNHEELANTLPRLGITGSVDVAITADDVALPKPDPEGIRLALDRLQIAADRRHLALYIGDTIHDMRAACGAGIRSIGVAWGAAGRNLLSAEQPTAICETPADLPKLLFGD